MKLIKTIDEVISMIPVPMTSELDVIRPFLNMAEGQLSKLISKAQFDKLAADYNGDNGDEIIKEAINISQRIIVNLGYYFAIPILSVKISTAGILINSNENTKQAFNWQVDDVKKSLLELGFSAVEDLLQHLENNSGSFPEYHSSDEFQKQKQFLINTASSFSDYFNIGGSRFIYCSIAYIMRRVEDQNVKPTFGSTFIDSLKNGIQTTSIKTLLNQYVKPGIALLTASKALRERVITFENGVASINLLGNYNQAKRDLPAEKEQTDAACSQLTSDGNRFLEDGITFIQDNPTDFPDFESPVRKKRFNITNSKERGIWAN